jgi:hypothetical protein
MHNYKYKHSLNKLFLLKNQKPLSIIAGGYFRLVYLEKIKTSKYRVNILQQGLHNKAEARPN